MIEKWVGVLSDWLCWLSALCIVGMMLLTSSDVALRYVGFPIKGTYDVVGLLGALVVALPIARTQVLNRHVSMEFMAQRKSRIARGIAQAITSVRGIAVYATVTWQLVAFAAKLAAAWCRLRRKAAGERRIAIVLANYPNRDGRMGNGVGLDVPASTVGLLADLAWRGIALLMAR